MILDILLKTQPQFKYDSEFLSNQYEISQLLYFSDLRLDTITSKQIELLIQSLQPILNPSNLPVTTDDERRLVTIGSVTYTYEEFVAYILNEV